MGPRCVCFLLSFRMFLNFDKRVICIFQAKFTDSSFKFVADPIVYWDFFFVDLIGGQSRMSPRYWTPLVPSPPYDLPTHHCTARAPPTMSIAPFFIRGAKPITAKVCQFITVIVFQAFILTISGRCKHDSCLILLSRHRRRQTYMPTTGKIANSSSPKIFAARSVPGIYFCNLALIDHHVALLIVVGMFSGVIPGLLALRKREIPENGFSFNGTFNSLYLISVYII